MNPFQFLLLLTMACMSLNLSSRDVDRYQLPEDQHELAIFENAFASSEFLSIPDLDVFHRSEILRVSYVYSAFHEGDFDQSALNDERKMAFDGLTRSTAIDFSTCEDVRQTSCDTRVCASQLFHGFVVEYKSLDLIHHTNLKRQVFAGPSHENKRFTTPSGLQIEVPSQSFVHQDGTSLTADYRLHIREAIELEDIILAGLITDSKDGVLQTGGMVEVMAYSSGRPLILKSGASVRVEVPAPFTDSDMQLYRGSLEGDRLNWVDPRPLDSQRENSCTENLDKVKSPFKFSVIKSVEWSTCEGLEWIKIEKSSATTRFDKEDFDLKLAIDYGLGTDRFEKMISWFDNGEVDTTMIDKDFWGLRLAIEAKGYTDSVAYDYDDLGGFGQSYSVQMDFLGWMNIDKLLKDQGKPSSIIAGKLDEFDPDVKSMMVLPDYRATLFGFTSQDEEFRYRGFNEPNARAVPNGTRGLIIAIKEHDNDRISIDVEPFVAGQENEVELKLAYLDLEQTTDLLQYHLYPEKRRK